MIRLGAKEPRVPTDLRKALAGTPRVGVLWKDLTPIARRDFISWIESAKQLKTRKRRIEITCSKLASGKRRPCCYAIVPMNLYKALGANPKAKHQWSTLTPDQKRDFVSWIKGTEDKKIRTQQVEKACAMLTAGHRPRRDPAECGESRPKAGEATALMR